MKKLFLFGLLFAAGTFAFGQAASSAAPAPATDMAVLGWTDQNFDFGEIKQGVPATHEFKFKNTGKVALVITNVKASCGCTTPDWTQTPVAPGADGFVKATYNAAGAGAFYKTVTVTANIEGGTNVLTIKGTVMTPNP
jgi:Protein of unknown function (DUF1573)